MFFSFNFLKFVYISKSIILNRLTQLVITYLLPFSKYGIRQPDDLEKGISQISNTIFEFYHLSYHAIRNFKSLSCTVTLLHNYQKYINYCFRFFLTILKPLNIINFESTENFLSFPYNFEVLNF